VITDLQMKANDGGDLAEHERAVALKTPLIIPTGVLLGPEGLRDPVGGKIAASRAETVPLARILP